MRKMSRDSVSTAAGLEYWLLDPFSFDYEATCCIFQVPL